MSTTRLVSGADGVSIAVEDAGNREGAPVVFLHGIAQSRQSFRPVWEGPLASDLRLLSVDLRGHGDSEKPDGHAAYDAGDKLGRDLHAVLEALSLSRPIVVAWSYGGVALGEYLRVFGSGALGGVLLVAAAIKVGKTARAMFGTVMMSNARALMSEDSAVYEAGSRAFLEQCAAKPIGAELVEASLVEMRRVPAAVRRALLSRSEDYSVEVAGCEVPVATLHGSRDDVVLPAMSEHVAATATGAVSSIVEGAGHVPWLEAPQAFGDALRGIVARR